jgi:hypothetical protein
LKEVEAESVAFVVSAVHGMATDDYSFPYVASWAGEEAGAAVARTQARVAGAAKTIIAVSPAEHTAGGKISGVETAVVEKQRGVTRQHAPQSLDWQVAPPVSLPGRGPELA